MINFLNISKIKAKKNLRVVSFGLSKKSDIHPISKFDLKTKIKWTIKSKNKNFNFKIK